MTDYEEKQKIIAEKENHVFEINRTEMKQEYVRLAQQEFPSEIIKTESNIDNPKKTQIQDK